MSDVGAGQGSDVGGLAREIKAETAALNKLLSQYASKAEVTKQLDQAKTDLSEQTNRGNRWRNLAIAIVAVVTIGFGVVANGASKTAERVDKVQQEQTASKTEAQQAVCAADNVRIDQHNLLVAAGEALQAETDKIVAFVTDVPAGVSLNPDQKARLDGLVKLESDSKALVESALATALVAPRHCDAAALAQYYATTTTAPPGG